MENHIFSRSPFSPSNSLQTPQPNILFFDDQKIKVISFFPKCLLDDVFFDLIYLRNKTEFAALCSYLSLGLNLMKTLFVKKVLNKSDI